MKGSLSTSSVVDLLLHLHQTGQTGVLRLTREDLKKSIYLVEGKIVFAHSNLKQDRLGETLLRLGKITPEEFELASVEVIQKGKRLGESLCDKGFLSPGEVISGVHYQLQQIIYSVFDWDQGEYEFVEKDRPVFEDIIVEISTAALLIEGIRNITNPNILKRSYKGDDNQIVVTTENNPTIPRTDLDFSEETLLACVDAKKTIAAIRNLTHLTAIEFDRALCSLLLSGMIRFIPGDAVSVQDSGSQPLEQNLVIDPPVSLATQPMRPEAEELRTLSENEMRAKIIETGERFRDATDEEVLGVFPDATQEEITEAYEHFFSLYHPYYRNDRFEDLTGTLKAILDRLADANTNLIEKLRVQLPLEEAPSFHLELNQEFENNETTESAPIPEEIVPAPVVQPEEAPIVDTTRGWTLSELQQQVRLHPADLELLRKLAWKLQQSGKPQEAEKQLLRTLELEPQNVENHLTLAEFYQKQGLRIKAFKHLNIVLQFDPENERAMDMLGLKKKKKALYEISNTD